jgi:hypothetical protein
LVEKILEEIPFFSKTTMDGSSWFGSNLTPRMHLREISQLMEPYPQLIPNIPRWLSLSNPINGGILMVNKEEKINKALLF